MDTGRWERPPMSVPPILPCVEEVDEESPALPLLLSPGWPFFIGDDWPALAAILLLPDISAPECGVFENECVLPLLVGLILRVCFADVDDGCGAVASMDPSSSVVAGLARFSLSARFWDSRSIVGVSEAVLGGGVDEDSSSGDEFCINVESFDAFAANVAMSPSSSAVLLTSSIPPRC